MAQPALPNISASSAFLGATGQNPNAPALPSVTGSSGSTPQTPMPTPTPAPVAPASPIPTSSTATPSGYKPPTSAGVVQPVQPVTSDGFNINPATGGISKPNTSTPPIGGPSPLPAPTVTPPAQPAAPSKLDTLQNNVTNAEAGVKNMMGTSPEEKATQASEDALKANFGLDTNANHERTVPMPFITGADAALSRTYNNNMQTLEATMARQQAARVASQGQSQFSLTRADTALQNERAFETPISVAPGTSLVTRSGQTVFGGTNAYNDKQAQDTFYNLQQTYPDASLSWDKNKSAQENLKAAQEEVQKSPTFQAKSVTKRQIQLPGGGIGFYNSKSSAGLNDGDVTDANGNVVGKIDGSGNYVAGNGISTAITPEQGASAKADAASLADVQGKADSITTTLNNAENGINHLTTKYGSKMNGTIPIANIIGNAVAYNLGSNDIAAFKGGLQEVANEYSQVFSRGGTNTVASHYSAEQILSGNLSMNQLKEVGAELKAQGEIVMKGYNDQISTIKGRMSSGSTNTPATQGSAPTGWGW